jgi:hypothetical protein
VVKHAHWTAIVAAVCLASGAQAADSTERILITDPTTLASLGFSPDAIVYLAHGASPGEAVPGPQPYGAADPVMVALAGNQFQGRISTYAYVSAGGQGEVSFTGGDFFADGQLHLPSGAVWENTRFWVNDTNAAQGIGLFMFESCLPPDGPGAPVSTQLAGGVSTGSGGEQLIVLTPAPGRVIDNNACIYWVRVRFDAVGLILRKARAQYRLQVSPAPAVATFPDDVPTSHPFFRFIEAMAKSGLTGGCGPGAFCPDDAVTRGQLSVFLAVALGLHFPN